MSVTWLFTNIAKLSPRPVTNSDVTTLVTVTKFSFEGPSEYDSYNNEIQLWVKMYPEKVDDFIFDSKESSQVIDEEISSQARFLNSWNSYWLPIISSLWLVKQKFENRLKFDHCESLLSDLEFMNKPSLTPKVSKKETKKVAGMETIKRQMDSLTEMVNDLQVVLVSDWLTF